MAVLKKRIRIVVAQSSYRKASHLRQILILAEYEQKNLFEAIESAELLQTLQDQAPIHLAIVTPTILAQLEKSYSLQTLYTQWPSVSLMLIAEEGDGENSGSGKVVPDYTLVPPVTAETLENGISTTLQRHERRILAMQHVEQGEAAMKQGLSIEAQASFAEAIRVGGPDPYPSYMLGDLFEQTGQTEQAIASFQQAWEKDPDYFEGLHRVVALYLSQGEGQRAIPYLEQAVGRGSVPVEGLVLLGTLYLEAGAIEEARITLKTACGKRAARAMSALVEQARAMLQRQGADATIALLQLGRDVQPEYAPIYALLGDLFTEQQQLREALPCYETLMRLSDPLPANYCRLARTYLALGHPLRADKVVREALRLDPQCEEAARLRVAILDHV
ncbi:MAG TPA: tetratricopeptide repeat protein [Candidatus Tectomicrobia bacterium]|jgi:tetratricopeptide (TPR) repeat protein